MRIERTSEYRTQSLELSRDEASALQSVAGIKVARSIDGATYDVTTDSRVGLVSVGDLVLEIRPKVGIRRTLFLVSYSLGQLVPEDKVVDVAHDTSIVDSMATLFAAALQRALGPGLLRGYREEEEALTVVRGRIRFDEQLRRHHGRFPPVEVRYDEFTDDIELNRILKAAVDRLRHLPLRSQPLRNELRHFEHLLAAVSLVEIDARRTAPPAFDRLSERYRTAIGLAFAILRFTSAELGVGALRANTFLVDMNVVFEDFVVTALRDALKLTARQFPQGCRGHRLSLDEAARVGLAPDLSWWEAGRCVFVGDVKYKRLNDKRVLHHDIYQMLAYLVATDLDAGLLVYAKGEGDPLVHKVRHLGRCIEVVAFDLAGPIDDLLAQVDDLAARVRSMRWRDEITATSVA